MATKSLIKKTRRPRDPFAPKVEKELTHISQEQALTRHVYCIPGHYCDHPKDGWCKVGNYPTVEELQEINNRLAGKGSETSPEMSTPAQVRTRQRREPKVVKYFCMACEKWHEEGVEVLYDRHLMHKRQRGQRLPSQLKPKTPAKYFCTKCGRWHLEDDSSLDGPNSSTPGVIRTKITGIYKSHAKYKRKRGRQKGWQLTAKK